jgi:hypothetical protein
VKPCESCWSGTPASGSGSSSEWRTTSSKPTTPSSPAWWAFGRRACRAASAGIRQLEAAGVAHFRGKRVVVPDLDALLDEIEGDEEAR